MNELLIFKNEDFGEIRTQIVNGEPWFAGKDVADALGYKNTNEAISAHVDNVDKGVAKCDTPGGNQNLVMINESGLYSLIFGSKLESAKSFKRWVTFDVLPSIRKTGAYQKPMTEKEMMRLQLSMIDDVSERVERLENNMVIDYGQQQVLKEKVNAVVMFWLGGKSSNAYREMAKKAFSECNHDFQKYFNVNSRNNTPKIKFDDAIYYIVHWEPCNNTKLEIQNCNAQMTIKED